MAVTGPAQRKRAKSSLFPWIICGLGAIFYSYEYLLRIAPSVMTSDLMQAFHINAEGFGNLVGFYYYAYAPAQLVVGILMDRYGPRRMLFLACLICSLGTYLFGITNSYYVASIGRFLIGFGSAFAFVGVLKLATIWLPPNRFALISGLTSALGTVGAMFGEGVLTALVEGFDWRNTVLFTAAVGVVLAIILLIFLRDGSSREARALDRKGSQKLNSILRSMGQILLNRQIWINGLIGCLLYLPTTAFAELWANPYFQTALSYSPNDAAYAVMAIFLGFTIGGPINGWISDKLGQRRPPLMVGGVLAAATIALVLYVPDIPKLVVFFLMFLFGVFYSVQVIVFAVGKEVSPANAAGTALAVTNGLVMLGGVIFQPAIGSMLNLTWDGTIVNNIHVYSASDYTIALTALPVSIALGSVLAYFLKETYCQAVQNKT